MGANPDGYNKRRLSSTLGRGAEAASGALTKWLGRPARLSLGEVDEVGLGGAAELLGPADRLVAACVLELGGRLSGLMLLVFEDASGLALADLLLGRPLGTATDWGELERSAAEETANIIGCAFLNALSADLPAPPGAIPEGIVPSPPAFRHEFAGSLLEFALMEQAMAGDRLFLLRARFETDQEDLGWSLLLVPGADFVGLIAEASAEPDST